MLAWIADKARADSSIHSPSTAADWHVVVQCRVEEDGMNFGSTVRGTVRKDEAELYSVFRTHARASLMEALLTENVRLM